MKAARLRRATPHRGLRVLAPTLAAVLLAGLTGCSSGQEPDTAAGTGSGASGSSASTGAGSTAATVQGPIGTGCGIFPAEGPGSPAAVASTPLGLSISAVPQLSTLTQGVIAANLVDVVNTRTDITVLAPSNAAFDALGPDALPALLADVPRLTQLLVHHVVPGRLTPDQLVGEHTTLNGDPITVTGPAEAPTLAADQTVAQAAAATVVCGNVPTANATVYVVDQVLAPAG